jgi:hypothetical protein
VEEEDEEEKEAEVEEEALRYGIACRVGVFGLLLNTVTQ